MQDDLGRHRGRWSFKALFVTDKHEGRSEARRQGFRRAVSAADRDQGRDRQTLQQRRHYILAGDHVVSFP